MGFERPPPPANLFFLQPSLSVNSKQKCWVFGFRLRRSSHWQLAGPCHCSSGNGLGTGVGGTPTYITSKRSPRCAGPFEVCTMGKRIF